MSPSGGARCPSPTASTPCRGTPVKTARPGPSHEAAGDSRRGPASVGVGHHPGQERRDDHRNGSRLGAGAGLCGFHRGNRRRRIRNPGHVRVGAPAVPVGAAGAQSGTRRRIRHPGGDADGNRRDRRALRRPYVSPARIRAPRGRNAGENECGQRRRAATADRDHVLRAGGSAGDDHGARSGRRPLPAWRPRGSRRYRLPGRLRRKTLDEVGGGVDPFMVRGEDYELNYRLREHGYTVWFDPNSKSFTGLAARCVRSPGSISNMAAGSGK